MRKNSSDHDERNALLRHLGYRGLPWIWLGMIPLGWVPGDQHDLIHRISDLLPVVLMIAMTVSSVWHLRDLCERCMRKVPLDGARRAERGTWRLKLHHNALKPILVVFVATLLFGIFTDPTSTLSRTLWSGVNLFYALLNFNSNRHDRLAFWCPWCKDDGDSDDEKTPDPQDDKNRPIPA